MGSAETRHALIFDKIKKGVKSKALEPSLSTVVRNYSLTKGKESINRGNVARLLQTNKRSEDLDFSRLQEESTLARNKVLLEHVMARRNLRNWRDQVLTELHEEKRNAKTGSKNRRSA